MKRIIFLDVDGVLNKYDDDATFNEFNVNNLIFLIEKTGAKIVLSSDWRRLPFNLERIKNFLLSCNLEIFDVTPVLNEDRKYEIKKWLRENEGWERVAVIDDLKNATVYKSGATKVKTFITDGRLGLTEEDVDSIILFMNS